jgi:hypothetical protein
VETPSFRPRSPSFALQQPPLLLSTYCNHEALHINVQAVMQLRSKRRDQDPEKNRPLTPHFIVSVARGPDVAIVRSLTDLCGLRVKVETYNAPKGPLQCKRCQRFGHTQRNCGYAPRCVACSDEHPSGKSVTPKQQLCCSCGENHTANYHGCSKWKEVKAAAAKRAQGEGSRKDGVSTRLPAPNSAPAKPSSEQEKLGSGWNHIVRGGRVVKAQATPSPASTSSDTGRRTERQVAPKGGQRKPACLKCRWWNPSHPVPNRLTPLPHRVSLHSRGSPISSRNYLLRPALS